MTNGECPHARHTTVCGPSRWSAGKPSAADPQDWLPLSKWTTLSSGFLTLAVPDTALLSIPLGSGDALGPVLVQLALWSTGSQSRECDMVLPPAVCISEHSHPDSYPRGSLC